MSAASRLLGIGVALGLAAGLLVGAGLTQPGRAAATTLSPAPSVSSGGAVVGASGAPAVTTVSTGGTAVADAAASGTAIAYPYFPGSPGLAPDHTIVVTGVGQADMRSDGSGRAAAQQRALGAALADAKTQADVIASATGLSISEVLSVSASVSPAYGVMPMAGSASGPASGQPVPPVIEPAYPQTLNVSVTVAYRVG